jgi:hypothetical protein
LIIEGSAREIFRRNIIWFLTNKPVRLIFVEVKEMTMPSQPAKHPDLFGGETEIKQNKTETFISEWIRVANYRPSENKVERCKNCIHHQHWQYHTKYLHKCDLLGMSHSAATDIKVNFTCNNYERMG